MKKLILDQLNRLSAEDARKAEKLPIVAVLDNVRSMHNVGSVFRTADAFQIAEICLCGFTPTPPHRDIQKTALGATETVPWRYEKDIATLLKQFSEENAAIFAVEQTDESLPLPQFLPPRNQKIVLVFGNEVDGVSEEALAFCQSALEIPQYGAKHSLNISVAAGVVLYQLSQQLRHILA